MALQDIVNKYNQNKGANSFLLTNDQDLEGQAQVAPAISEIKSEQTAQENKDVASSNAMPTVKYPSKPETMSDGDYEHLMNVGFSPDAISNYTKPYDPSTNGNYLQRIFENSVPKPTALDDKRIKGAKIVSGIGDALGLISQMWSAGKGAYVKERDFNSSALAQTAAKEKELSNIYMQQQNKYNDGMYNARLKDFLTGLDDYNNGRKGIQGALAAKQKADQAADQFKEKQRFAYDKLVQDQTNKDADRKIKEDNLKSMDRHRKAMEAQGWSRVADSRNRTAAYVKKMSSGGSGSNSNYQMIFNANPSDKDIQTDSFGNKVKVLEMNKGQIDRYTREALSDPNFLQKHPQFDRKPGLLGEAPKSFTEKERVDIAAAYMQEQYDNSFTQLPIVPTSTTQPIVNWEQINNVHVPGWDEMSDDETETVEDENSEDWNWID